MAPSTVFPSEAFVRPYSLHIRVGDVVGHCTPAHSARHSLAAPTSSSPAPPSIPHRRHGICAVRVGCRHGVPAIGRILPGQQSARVGVLVAV